MLANDSQPDTQPVTKSPRYKMPRRNSKSDMAAARDLVFAARIAGKTIAQAAKVAGVSIQSASRWCAKAGIEQGKLDREAAIKLLSVRVTDQATPPQYIAPLTSLLADLNGWKQRDNERVVLKSMADLFNSWKAETLGGVGVAEGK